MEKVLSCLVFREFVARELPECKELFTNDVTNEELYNGIKEAVAHIDENIFDSFIPKNKEYIASLKNELLTGDEEYQELYIKSFVNLLEGLELRLSMDFHYSFKEEDLYFGKLITDSGIFKLIECSEKIHKNVLRGLTVSSMEELDLIKSRGVDLLATRTEAELTLNLLLDVIKDLKYNVKFLVRNLSVKVPVSKKDILRAKEVFSSDLFSEILKTIKIKESEVDSVFEVLIKEGRNEFFSAISKNKYLPNGTILKHLHLLDIEELLRVNPFSLKEYEEIINRSPLDVKNFSIHSKHLDTEGIERVITQAKEKLKKDASFHLISYETINPDLFNLGFSSSTYFFREEGIRPCEDFSKIDNLDYIYDLRRGRLAITERGLNCPISNLNLSNLELPTYTKKVKRSNLNPAIQILLSNKPEKEINDFFYKTKKEDPQINQIFRIHKKRGSLSSDQEILLSEAYGK